MEEKIKFVEDMINNPEFNPENYFGYIYMTEFLNLGKLYIGKKQFFSNLNKKLGKKELILLPIKRGKKPTTKLVINPSNWENYYGSEKEVIELAKTEPKDKIIRYVLKLCKTKKELTYYETKFLFLNEVLENQDKFLNKNILGKFFSKDLETE